MIHLEIKEEAKKDILQAVDWYKHKGIELDLKFIEQLEITLKAIRKNPGAFKKIVKLLDKLL